MPAGPISDETATCRLCWQELPAAAAPEAVLEAILEEPLPAALESSALDPRWGRYSLFACRPVEIITLRQGAWTDRRGVKLPGRSVRGTLKETVGRFRAGGKLPVPYGPGWIGYIGYEFGRHLEHLPGRAVRDTSLPDAHLAFYDAVAVYDAIRRRWYLTRLVGGPCEPSGAAEVLAGAILSGPSAAAAPPEDVSPAPRAVARARSNFTPQAYRDAVARCIEYIAAGDIFQVNLSQRLTVDDPPSPAAIYRSLRRRNPSWYSAMLLLDGPAVVSSSPELFLRVRGRRVMTRPIKGTRPRMGDPAADAAAAAELLASEKDNAELAMIIDLLRNDLGRVCRYGSVRVARRRQLETHPTVFHLVGAVTGELYDGVDTIDLLSATFPGGSVTGAPKIRAMEIIDELEDVARGAYTGSIGYFGANGNCELNIVIRTVVCDGPAAYVQVGGGIVADSTPDGEYRETLDKARAVLEAIAAAGSG